jgi:hypothetical protein
MIVSEEIQQGTRVFRKVPTLREKTCLDGEYEVFSRALKERASVALYRNLNQKE